MINSTGFPVNFRWLSLREILDRYMSQTELEPGCSAASLISGLTREMRARRLGSDLFHKTGGPHSQASLEADLKQLESEVAEIRAKVLRHMMQNATAGLWFAFGRSDPDKDHEIVPARMWPFLTLDLENNAATGKTEYRDLRCGVTAEVKETGALASALHGAAPVFHTGAAGRPTAMKPVQEEFARRVSVGQIENSLARQSQRLAEWLVANHPGAPRLSAKRIETGIRSAYRAAKATQATPK